jgi:hypothetical protein
VSQGKNEEHEKVIAKINKKNPSKFKWFNKRFSPPTIVCVAEFDDLIAYETWVKEMMKDEEFAQVVKDFLSTIELNSYQPSFWETRT